VAAEPAAVELLGAGVRGAGGLVAATAIVGVDASDLDKMCKLDKSGRAQRQPQLRIALALLEHDVGAAAAMTPLLAAYLPQRPAQRFTRQQVLEAVGMAVASMPDLLTLLLPRLQRELGATSADAVMEPLTRSASAA